MSGLKRNITPFAGVNYSVWKFRVRALLKELKVLKVVDGAPGRNEDWTNDEATAKNVVIEYLDDAHLNNFVAEDTTTKQIFEKLEAVYARKSVMSQLAAHNQLLNLRFNGDIPLKNYFIKFDELVNEATMAGSVLPEPDKICRLLHSLPPAYDGVVVAIQTLANENIQLAEIKTRLLDFETRLKNPRAATDSAAARPSALTYGTPLKALQAAAVDAEASSDGEQSPDERDFRERQGVHKKGFKKDKRRFKKNCYFCKQEGHLIRNCFSLQSQLKDELRNEKSAHAVQRGDGSGSTSVATVSGKGFAFMASGFQHQLQMGD